MNVNELTCAQVNEAIARLRGAGSCWAPGKIRCKILEYPDYCHDWGAAGMLLAEMARASGTGVQIWYYRGWHCLATAPNQDRPRGQGLEPPEAIARAYHAWRTEADK